MRERFDLVVLQAAGHALHHRIGQLLVTIGFDQNDESGFGHPENVGNGAARSRTTMASHALRGKIAAELKIALLGQSRRRPNGQREARACPVQRQAGPKYCHQRTVIFSEALMTAPSSAAQVNWKVPLSST